MSRFVSCGHTIKIWDSPNLDLVSEVRVHRGTINSACYSPNGQTIARCVRQVHAR